MPNNNRKPKQERRREIACTALRIIGEHGQAALTMNNLAKSIGVTSGALFRHFETRDEMLIEAVRWAVEQVETTWPDEELAPLQRLELLAQKRIRLLRAEPGIAWLLRSDHAMQALPLIAVKRLRELVGHSRKVIRMTIQEAVDAGELRDDVPIPVLALNYVATIHALVGMPSLLGETQMSGRQSPGISISSGLKGWFCMAAAN